jgi:hypothetical protein
MDASLIAYDWDLDGGPGVNRKDEEDKVIVDLAQLEGADSPSARASTPRADETRPVFARGTRDRVQVPNSHTAAGVVRGHGPRELERDPVAVFRAWPHSKTGHAEPGERPRTALPPSRAQRRVEDKIVLAHLALDLFREIDQLETIVERAQGTAPCDAGRAVCTDPQCAAKVDVLRGALVEACLLVQRVAMMAPTERIDIEDRIHDLLQLLQR